MTLVGEALKLYAAVPVLDTFPEGNSSESGGSPSSPRVHGDSVSETRAWLRHDYTRGGEHGWFLGDLEQWHKHSNFERAVRSPLVVRSPGVKAGTGCDRLVETVDIFPTTLDFAGLKPFPLSDGRSFLPLLNNPQQTWKDRACHIFNRGKVIGYAVRTEHARYVEWHANWSLDTPVLAREFYRYTAE